VKRIYKYTLRDRGVTYLILPQGARSHVTHVYEVTP
jgi:hypothetical protein